MVPRVLRLGVRCRCLEASRPGGFIRNKSFTCLFNKRMDGLECWAERCGKYINFALAWNRTSIHRSSSPCSGHHTVLSQMTKIVLIFFFKLRVLGR